jgi:hypothetical protein
MMLQTYRTIIWLNLFNSLYLMVNSFNYLPIYFFRSKLTLVLEFKCISDFHSCNEIMFCHVSLNFEIYYVSSPVAAAPSEDVSIIRKFTRYNSFIKKMLKDIFFCKFFNKFVVYELNFYHIYPFNIFHNFTISISNFRHRIILIFKIW